LRCIQFIAIDRQEREQRRKGGSLIPLDEGLRLRDPMSQRRSLRRDVRVLIVSMRPRPHQSPCQSWRIPKLITRLIGAASENLGVQAEDIIDLQVDEIRGARRDQRLGLAVVVGEYLQCATIVSDDLAPIAPHDLAKPIGR